MHSHYVRPARSQRKFGPCIRKRNVSGSPGGELHGLRLASFSGSSTSRDERQTESNEIVALDLPVNRIGDILACVLIAGSPL